MSETLRENAQWRKAKTPIVSKYIDDHSKMMAEIAGRGFLNLPGYAYDIENNLELTLKQTLSETNYKILSETIDRELKQAGFTYNQEYKTAALTFEIEKQSLVAAWDAELAGIKQGMANDEEIKTRLAIEVAARQGTLITTKTAIEIEMEGYRLQLAELEDDTAPYEVSLAQAKLLTAQKKLELIPILQEICDKEEELLDLEEDKATELTTLLNEKSAVAGKRALLEPYYLSLANKTQELAGLIPTQISKEEQIADEKLAQAEAIIEKEENKLSEMELDIDTANTEVEIGAAKRDLQETKFDNEQTLTRTEIDNENLYQNEVTEYYDRIIEDERATQDEIISEKHEINNIKNETEMESMTTITDEQKEANNSNADADIYEMRQKAIIQAASQITAGLTHIIG
jgi:hypothetical protein